MESLTQVVKGHGEERRIKKSELNDTGKQDDIVSLCLVVDKALGMPRQGQRT